MCINYIMDIILYNIHNIINLYFTNFLLYILKAVENSTFVIVIIDLMYDFLYIFFVTAIIIFKAIYTLLKC